MTTLAQRTIEEEFTAWSSNDPRVIDDPYPFFHRLRAEAPVHRHAGVVFLSRYSDCAAAGIETRLHKTDGKRYDYGFMDRASLPQETQRQLDELFEIESPALNKTEGETHTRIRSLVQTAFTPKTIQGLEDRIVKYTESLLDDVSAAGRMDAIADLAYQLPLGVICDMLDVPTEDRSRIREWGLGISGLFGGVRDDIVRVINSAHRNRKELRAFMEGIVARRRAMKDAPPSVLSLMIEAGAGGRLSDVELVANASMFVFAGHETTTNAIGNGLVALMANRDQWDLLCADLALARSAADEALRYISPVQAEPRYATTDVSIGDAAIEKGERVRMIWAAANRDPDRFPDPDRFDIRREDNRHLALGIGRHYCLGSALARAEIATAFSTLARRFPDMRMAEDRAHWRPAFNIRGVDSLPLVLWRDRG